MPDKRLIKPPLDLAAPEQTVMATFSMGCFWSPDALFGSVEAVVRTRVGYAGGTSANPTYWTLADHIETLQLEYDPAKTNYSELLQLFFSSHKATRAPWKRQYMSAMFYHNPEQEQQARQAKAHLMKTTGEKVFTEIYPFEKFYLAEDRHQKYKLQRLPALLEEFLEMYPTITDLTHSTAAARINGYLYGYGNLQNLAHEIDRFGLSPAGQKILFDNAKARRTIRCSS
ncbi:peptide-methionine (S)-S-oxide reductase [Pontibacter diazotrophicus]|uniref:peptide-methionine (S)-S-oxide reductase n=1 Tax=Pontibacter diazotrophicus TaxID=1400979 RepID=A0A3D8LH84_9BACT|nr:peptide-methionine (S)-S-oxide reductase [Pontibacter diazotrophicus]RDV16737.1 peptide-methionine (S)-S-oxide reductase [Pontibacter diazotrophicus]